MIPKCISLEYEPSSEPLHISRRWPGTHHELDFRKVLEGFDVVLQRRVQQIEPRVVVNFQVGYVRLEAGSYLRLIDSCITQLKAQGPSRFCNESKEEVKKNPESL